MTELIRVENLHKRFGSLEVLKGIDLNVHSGGNACFAWIQWIGKVYATSLYQFHGRTKLWSRLS